MHDSAERQRVAVNVWTARIIPVLLAGVVGYATYVLVALLSVNYLLVQHNDKSAVIPILIIYFILFLFMAISFFRLVYITMFDPPYVPLGLSAINRAKQSDQRKHTRKFEEDGIGGGEYALESYPEAAAGSKDDPDSPGLELFYTKNIFVAEMDGRPRWCPYCSNWKPDRTHHCSSSGRCIRKMDHFCPWVGGPVGETNYKFFIQFNGYTALYCAHLLVVMAVYISRQHNTEGESINRHFAVIIGLAGFFWLFTFGMCTSALDLAMKNLTQVENLGAKSRLHTLAIIKPSAGSTNRPSLLSTSQYSFAEVTYPLGAVQAVERDQLSGSRMLQQTEGRFTSNLSTTEAAARQGENPHQPPMPTVAERADNIGALQSNSYARETLTKRDLGATRTFAILRMNPGDNPWNLGSKWLNLQTVMGKSFSEYFLPIRRSPCCKHESTESQFETGPWVDQLRANFGLISPEEVRPLPKKRTKFARTAEKNLQEPGGGSFEASERHMDDTAGGVNSAKADSSISNR